MNTKLAAKKKKTPFNFAQKNGHADLYFLDPAANPKYSPASASDAKAHVKKKNRN